MKINVANPSDKRCWPGYLFSFGAYGCTWVVAYGSSIEDALEEAAGWLADNAPGLLVSQDEMAEAYQEAAKELGLDWDKRLDWGDDWERVTEIAETDLTYTESGYLRSWEWWVQEITPVKLRELSKLY